MLSHSARTAYPVAVLPAEIAPTAKWGIQVPARSIRSVDVYPLVRGAVVARSADFVTKKSALRTAPIVCNATV